MFKRYPIYAIYKTAKEISKLQGSFINSPIYIPVSVIQNAIIQLMMSLVFNILTNLKNPHSKILTRNKQGKNHAAPIETLKFKTLQPDAYNIINRLFKKFLFVILKKKNFQRKAGKSNLFAEDLISSIKLLQYFEKLKKYPAKRKNIGI